ncbi:MAG: polysulfide reductase NrfD [Granulosicoccus sp.]|nr:polysulfide reductase NrfD [Granulosicoccus sp.]
MVVHFKQLNTSSSSFIGAIIFLILLIAVGGYAAHAMESYGHWVSGMNNQIVWGLPHVFAIFLILAASGALNVASMGSVFSISIYKPWSRFSALLAICLLVGGLLVLVLDLGRPERLIVAMTHYNFKSIFAWNIFLYTGFIAITIAYLGVMFERRFNVHTTKVGVLALVWRLVLTSGTGSIFGFIVARQFFDAAMMVPLFIVLSLVLGTAVFILMYLVVGCWGEVKRDQDILLRLTRLLGYLLALELLLVAVFHLTNLYAAEHHGVERFILLEGGVYTVLFWMGQITVGCLAPLALIFATKLGSTLKGCVSVSLLSIFGGLTQLYVTIIGGQAFPLILFPGKQVRSSFFDGIVAEYTPAIYEWALGFGGIAVSLLLVIAAMRVLPFLPEFDRLTASTQSQTQ